MQHARKEKLLEQLDISKMSLFVGVWVNARPAIRRHDADVEIMVEKNIPGEIEETAAERENEGRGNFNPLGLNAETVDILFFILAMMTARGMNIDFDSVARRVNGQGGRSDIYDTMVELVANAQERTLERDMREALIFWASAWLHQPEPMNPNAVLSLVSRKNSRNYPTILFNGKHPLTGIDLSSEDLEESFTHARKCLRFIRIFVRDKLGRNVKYGIETSDWLPYRELILQYWQPESFEILRVLVYTNNGLQVPNPTLDTIQ